jgi:hypothetical protein
MYNKPPDPRAGSNIGKIAALIATFTAGVIVGKATNNPQPSTDTKTPIVAKEAKEKKPMTPEEARSKESVSRWVREWYPSAVPSAERMKKACNTDLNTEQLIELHRRLAARKESIFQMAEALTMDLLKADEARIAKEGEEKRHTPDNQKSFLEKERSWEAINEVLLAVAKELVGEVIKEFPNK